MSLNALQVLAKFRDAFLALDEFAEAGGFDELNKTATSTRKTAAKTSAKKSEPVEDADDDETPEVPSAEEAAKMSVVELRKLAVALDLEEQKAKAGILAELEELRGEDADDDEDEDDEEFDEDGADDEDDEDAEEDDEDSDEPYTREELEGKSLKELRVIAKEEGVPASEYRGADVDKLIDLIVGEDGDEDDDEDADDDESVEELDEDAVRKMSVAELLKLADEVGVTVPRRVKADKNAKSKKEALVNLIMDSADDEDDDE